MQAETHAAETEHAANHRIGDEAAGPGPGSLHLQQQEQQQRRRRLRQGFRRSASLQGQQGQEEQEPRRFRAARQSETLDLSEEWQQPARMDNARLTNLIRECTSPIALHSLLQRHQNQLNQVRAEEARCTITALC